MNLRVAVMFVIIFTLIAGGIYFSRVVGDYAKQFKQNSLIKQAVSAPVAQNLAAK